MRALAPLYVRKKRKPRTQKDEFDAVARLEIALMEAIQANPGITTQQLVPVTQLSLQRTQALLRKLAAARCCVRKLKGWYLAPVGVEVEE